MRTFENFRKVVNESDYILSEAQRYLEILLEKDSEALKQYKASQKSFKKGFGKNIKPTVVQPGLDLYKAGGPFVPDKTTFKDTGKKVPKMEPKPQFGKPKIKNKAPDRTGLKQTITNIRASDKRLYDAGVGKKPSLVQQRKYTKERIKQLSRQTTLKDRMYGSTGSTEGMGGASGSSKTTKPKVTPTKGVKQSEVSKDQRQFDKKINQARIEKTSKTTNTSGYSQSNKPTAGSEPTLFKRVKPNAVNAQVVGSTPFDSKSGVKSKGTRTMTTTAPPKGQEYTGRTIAKTRKVKSTIFNPPDYGTASYYKRQGKDAFDLSKNPITKKVSTSKGPQLPKFLNMRTGNINVRKTKGAVDYSKLSSANKSFARTSSAIVRKIPKVGGLQKVASGVAKAGLKLGRGGRLAVPAAILGTVLSPAGRTFIGTALAGGGLSYLLNRKGPPKLKVGDGITKTTNMPSKYQPKGAKDGKIPYTDVYGKKKTMGTGDIRFRFGLTGTKPGGKSGGRVENQKDIARVKSIQKKYIDDYNKKASRNPFKKSIKYTVNKDGSYNVTPPKAK